MWKASDVIGEGSDSFPIVEEIEAKKRGIRCVVYSKPLKLTTSASDHKNFNFCVMFAVKLFEDTIFCPIFNNGTISINTLTILFENV